MGRLPTSVTTDPSVQPLRELAYLPAGEIDPHGVAADRPRAGQLPDQVLATLPKTAANEGESSSTAPSKEENAG